MTFLQLGLGSMGKRRIRCLRSLGFTDILGIDTREDRRAEAAKLYGVRTMKSAAGLSASDVDALVISTPPDRHRDGIALALSLRRPAFVEVNLVLRGMPRLAALARKTRTLIAPSCTLRFHPAVERIKQLVSCGKYGKITNFSYHCGQYLPDWHPWESVKDFFVSKKETSGCRELMAFEMAWLTDVMGPCLGMTGFLTKTTDVGADIDDTYALALHFASGATGTVLADVTSRYATRRFLLNLEKGQILWNWDEAAIKVYNARSKRWARLPFGKGDAARGYNKNILEDVYAREIAAFVAAARGKAPFPNTLDEDIRILKSLDSLERTAQRP